jgi:DUF4097 and DUF4098 domain-containing protein YvlB
MRAIPRLTTVLGLACALAVCAAASDRDKITAEFHQTYPLAANGSVALENINGAVHIATWERNEVKVDAVKSAYSQKRLDEAKIEVDAHSDRVSIKTQYPDHSWNNDNEDHPANVEYTLTVPRAVRIDEVKLVNGPLDITGVSGEVQASLVNGNLTASGLSGPVKLSTVNGRSEVALTRLSDSPIEISSVNGHLEVILPSNARAEIEASTVNGGISNDFGLRVHRRRYIGSDMHGQLAGGGTRVRLSNVNGKIDVRHANDSQALSPAKDMDSASDDGDDI